MTKGLIDNFESNSCSLPVLELLDFQIDSYLLSELVINFMEEHVKQTPPPSKTSAPIPEAEQAERERKRSNESKPVPYQTASVLTLHAEFLSQLIKMPKCADYVVKGIRVVLNYTFSIAGTVCFGIKFFLSIVNVNHTASYMFSKN